MDEHYFITKALREIGINYDSVGGDSVDDFVVGPESLNETIDREAVRAKVEELRTVKAFETLRRQRDEKLKNTDHYGLSDFPFASEDQRQAWLDYRQALRDLPANSPNATIDPESGSLVGVAWPDEPQN